MKVLVPLIPIAGTESINNSQQVRLSPAYCTQFNKPTVIEALYFRLQHNNIVSIYNVIS